MGLNILALGASKTYTEDTADQFGAIKGAPCTISGITDNDDGTHTVNFAWTNNAGVTQTSALTVSDGAKGEDGTTAINDTTSSTTSTYSSSKIDEKIASIPSGGSGGTTVVANPILSGNEETATSIQIGNEKYTFPQTNTNGLTSSQITLLESVLYACAFTDASGKSKVDALITSLRSGLSDSGNTGGGSADSDNAESGGTGSTDSTPTTPEDTTPDETNNEKILTFEFTSGKNISPTAGAVDTDGYYGTLEGVDISGYDYITVSYLPNKSGYSIPNVIFSNASNTDSWTIGVKVTSANAQEGELGRWATGGKNYVYLASSKIGSTYLDRVVWKAIKEA